MTSTRAYPTAPAWAHAMRTVGVTGTNGKTSTALLLAAALSDEGVPPPPALTTIGLAIGGATRSIGDHRQFVEALKTAYDGGERRAVLEMTSLSLARGGAKAWPFHGAIFTSFSHDHLDLHASASEYLAAKAQLFMHVQAGGFAVLPVDDPAAALVEEVISGEVSIYRYGEEGRRSPQDAMIRDVEVSWSGTRVRMEDGTELAVPLVGRHFARNAVAALVAARAMGVDSERAARGIARAATMPGRFERVADAPNVVVDYAHSPDAMVKTMATARQLARGARVVVVFGAAGGTDRSHRPALARAAGAADRVIVTTDNARDEDGAAIASELRNAIADHAHVEVLLDRRSAIAAAITDARPNDVVIVAGKGHETEQVERDEARPFSDAAVVRELVAGAAHGFTRTRPAEGT
ncbi:MAG TPA: UDP-N-acetylmuramyl-tripeptide synthetase [Labilithrix sp.]|nr:UDP-N-acetylmuramyl-tripeptide synthetase [Labilithrix sp.]